jgi:hypothetical protein
MLNKPDQNGVTLRENLEQVERQTKRRPADLDGPEFPYAVSHIWSAFVSLSSARSQGFSGPLPISYTEMKAWMELTQTYLQPFEVDAVKKLDSTYLRIANG